jgi:cell shape-determining protein MreC
MFTNSAIISKTDLDLSIYDFMYGTGQYLNPQRFNNVHSAIFLTAFFLFIAVQLIRYTLWSFFITIYQSCFKRFKAYLRPEKKLSENVYDEMSLKHLYQEYEKTQEEIKKLEELKSRNESLTKLMTRLRLKLELIETTFRGACSRLTLPDAG